MNGVVKNPSETTWFQAYRPQSIRDCILPRNIKTTFQKFVDKGEIPNLILAGRSGVGKTTVAKALLNEMGYDSMFINASLNRNIDLLRAQIAQYASAVSFTGGRKFVILDEADYLNPQSTQPALRAFMEEYSSNCGFILTCNYINRILPPIQGRCSVIDFTVPKDEIDALLKATIMAMKNILDNENIQYDIKAVAVLVKTLFPDIRRIVNELQRYSVTGKIDTGVIAGLRDESFDKLIASMREGKFNDMRVWVGEHADLDFSTLIGKLYPLIETQIESRTIPSLVLTLNKYDYQNSFVVNKEINTVACLLELMTDLQFKTA